MAGEKRLCKAIKSGGGRCSKTALDGSDYCYAHSRERAEERRKNASAGGKARSRRPPSEIEVLKSQTETIIAAVLKGGMDARTNTVDRNTGAVIFQGMNTLLRAIEVERKLDHQRELEEQVAALRSHLDELRARRRG